MMKTTTKKLLLVLLIICLFSALVATRLGTNDSKVGFAAGETRISTAEELYNVRII